MVLMKARVAEVANVPLNYITISVTGGSVNINVKIAANTITERNSFASAFTNAFPTTSMFQARVLQPANPSAVVLSGGAIVYPPSPPPSPPSPPPSPPPMAGGCGCHMYMDGLTPTWSATSTCVKFEAGKKMCKPCISAGNDYMSCASTLPTAGCTDAKGTWKCQNKFQPKGRCRKLRRAIKKCQLTCGLCGQTLVGRG